jgi:hypothetical protein
MLRELDRSAVSPAPALSRKGVIAVVVGNWLEFYDFLAFTFSP